MGHAALVPAPNLPEDLHAAVTAPSRGEQAYLLGKYGSTSALFVPTLLACFCSITLNPQTYPETSRLLQGTATTLAELWVDSQGCKQQALPCMGSS